MSGPGTGYLGGWTSRDEDARDYLTTIRKLASLIKTGEYSSIKNIEMLDEIIRLCEYAANTYDIVDEMGRA